MKCIDEVIKKIQSKETGDEGNYIIMRLALADKLAEICREGDCVSYVEKMLQPLYEILEKQHGTIEKLKTKIDGATIETIWYLDKIAQIFCEIIGQQQDIIDALKAGRNPFDSETGKPMGLSPIGHSNYLPALQSAALSNKKEEAPFEVPEDGKFESSSRVKEAFVAYLKGIIKNERPLSHTTVYDYSSRINMLFTYFERERKAGKLEGKLQIEAGKIIDNGSYLSVYNNLELFEAYVREKEREIKEREAEKRPFSAEELELCPLLNPKNLRNSIAALAKFREFKARVAEIVKARGEM